MHKWTISWSEELIHYDVNGDESISEMIGECVEEVDNVDGESDLREAVEEMVERFFDVGAELSDDAATYYPDVSSAKVVESLVGPIEQGSATSTHYRARNGAFVTDFSVETVTASR